MHPEVQQDELKQMMLLALAAVGGALGYIFREIQMGRNIKVLRALFAASTSVFFCFLLRIICTKIGLDPDWQIVVIGVFSWLGADATANIVLEFVLRKLGIGHGYYKVGDIEVRDTGDGGAVSLAPIYRAVHEIPNIKSQDSGSPANNGTATEGQATNKPSDSTKVDN